MDEFNFVNIFNKLNQEIMNDINTGSPDSDDSFVIIQQEDIDRAEYTEFVCINENSIDKNIEESTLTEETNNNSVIFEMEPYFEKIFTSYKYDVQSIWEQTKIDLPRTLVVCNKIPVTEVDHLVASFPQYKDIPVTYKGNTFTLLDIIALLCNQSSYAFPYFFFHKLKGDFTKNKMISNLPSNRKVSFKIKDGKLVISMRADFGIMNFETNQLEAKISMKLSIDEKSVNNVKLEDLFSRYGILEWTCV